MFSTTTYDKAKEAKEITQEILIATSQKVSVSISGIEVLDSQISHEGGGQSIKSHLSFAIFLATIITFSVLIRTRLCAAK